VTPKFLTLTIPHSGDVRNDVAALTQSWRRYWRRVEAHLAKDRQITRRIKWLRVLEISPSGGGHAHLHAIVLAPYIHQPLLAHLWAQSLPASYRAQVPTEPLGQVLARLQHEWQREQLASYLRTRRGPHGRPLAQVYAPVVDVREWRAGAGSPSQVAGQIAAETAKYMIKDAERTDSGELRWNPLVFSRCYEAAEGHRTVATSRQFWLDDPYVPTCQSCGDSGCLHTVVVRSSQRQRSQVAAQPRAP
jgi:hypothetical protein